MNHELTNIHELSVHELNKNDNINTSWISEDDSIGLVQLKSIICLYNILFFHFLLYK